MGKHVVTANKHVIAHHGPELEAIARRTGATLRFEAAVGGGIPVLGPLASDLAGNRIERVRGIVNGTTNYILSAMTDEDDPLDYATALAEAQRLGYAEADPAGDVEGLDAVNKLVILARLAFDRWLDPAAIPTRPEVSDGPAGPGITTVCLADQADARGGRPHHPAAGDGLGRAATASSRRQSCRRPSRSTRRSGGRPVSATGSRSTACRSGAVGFDGPGAGGAATVIGRAGRPASRSPVAPGRPGAPTAGAAPLGRPVGRPPGGVLVAASGIRYPIDD